MRPHVIASLALLSACAHQGAHAPPPGVGTLHTRGVGGPSDPTVLGARLLPEHVEEDRALGAEPGGGVRGIAGGVRIVSLPSGAILATDERLPQAPLVTAAVPERLGGGFLFVLGGSGTGSVVWRADRWLADARPIARWEGALHSVVFGLDRVYLRATNGSTVAIDGRTGARLDLGPWPGSSFVGAYAAVDGWRAVAVNDLRGAVATFDAGATWRPLGLPIDVKDVRLVGDVIAIGGTDASRESAWYELRSDGQVGRLGALPTSSTAQPAHDDKSDSAPRPLGKHPLVAAIEDGWPLADGTAVVARDGALSRVRLSDGALLEHAPDAFPLRPSRCHPMSLARDRTPTAFGFVCGEVRGATIVYAYDAAHGALVPLHRFNRPRVVLAFDNGALALKGSCDADAEESATTTVSPDKPDRTDETTEHLYCLIARDGVPRPLRVKGAIDGERLVVLRDGRVAVISPPHGDLLTARLTIFAGDAPSTVPITFHAKDADPMAPLAPDAARALRFGVWMDGFEERRPGVLGGWVDAGGSVVGVEIALSGAATHGPYIRDAGTPMVSGRYGLGWSVSRRGVETTDGGMTWTPLELPEPLVAPRAVAERACGPVGCTAGGWLRVGWGSAKNRAPIEPPLLPHEPSRATSALELNCEPLASPPPAVPEAFHATASQASEARARAVNPWGGTAASVLGGTNGMDLPPFYVAPPPQPRADERGITAEASERFEHYPRTGPLARIYAWGPKTGEWEHASRWIARWVSPFGGWQDVHTSAPAAPPQLLLDAARFTSVSAPMLTPWQLGVSDDGPHALLATRHPTGHGTETALFEVEDGHAPLELRRADGEPWGEIDSAVRAAGRWYVATPPSGDASSVVWQIDGLVAREFAHVPRAGSSARPPSGRLARRSDGRAIGFVVDGEPAADRPGALRWVLPIDLESGAPGDVEALGAADLGDRGTVSLCAEDDAGWVLDTPWNLGTRAYVGGKYAGSISSVDARVRVTTGRVCVERLAGTMGALTTEQASILTRTGGAKLPAGSAPAVPVVAVSASSRTIQMRYPLRCVRRSP